MSKTIRIYCENVGESRLFPMGVSLLEVYESFAPSLPNPVIAAKVNHLTRSLSYELFQPKRVRFIDLTDASGMRVYVRTLTFLISAAVSELFPGAAFRLEHSVSNGYYCRLQLGRPYTNADIEAIRERVKVLSKAALSIVRVEEETSQVVERFRQAGRHDLVSLFEAYGKLYASYYTMGEHIDCFYGAVAHASQVVNLFDLVPYDQGEALLLRVPDAKQPDCLAPMLDQPKLLETFKEYVHWNQVMNMSNVGDLNRACRSGQASDMIKVSEALQEKKIAQMADDIASRSPKVRVVLVAGPSSSGKTTFSKRLSIQLMALGLRPIALSLDDYFLERTQTPRDENGDYDYESLYALDLDLFNQQLVAILNGETVRIPTYNFTTGTKSYSDQKTICLQDDMVLILEGIHALNPQLIPAVSPELQYKIYVSALTSVSLDDHNRIPTTDNRLLRRIIRDAQYRGTSAQATIARWPSVRAGEDKWIFPYQENADAVFNSALLMEISILKRYAEQALHQVPQSCPEYSEAHRLLRCLRFFTSLGDAEIPPTSLLREFVGGSSFRY